jgi:methylphosphotriester-DNA--protein-cysteine methyltransferase
VQGVLKLKKLVLFLLVFFIVALVSCSVTTPQVHGKNYVASIKSVDKVFHNLDCFHVKQIKPKNKIFFETCEEAFKAGYRPCKDCKPCQTVSAVSRREKLAVVWGRIKSLS